MNNNDEPLELLQTITSDSDDPIPTSLSDYSPESSDETKQDSDDESASGSDDDNDNSDSGSDTNGGDQQLVELKMAQRVRNAKKSAQAALKKKLAKLKLKRKKSKKTTEAKSSKQTASSSSASAPKKAKTTATAVKKSRKRRASRRKKRGEGKNEGTEQSTGAKPSGTGGQPSTPTSTKPSSKKSRKSSTGNQGDPQKTSKKKTPKPAQSDSKGDESDAGKPNTAPVSGSQQQKKKKKVSDADDKDSQGEKSQQKKKKKGDEKEEEKEEGGKLKKTKVGKKEKEGDDGDDQQQTEGDTEKKKKKKKTDDDDDGESGGSGAGGAVSGALSNLGGGDSGSSGSGDTPSLGDGGGSGGTGGGGFGGSVLGGSGIVEDTEIEDDTSSAADLAATATSPSEQEKPNNDLVGRKKREEKALRKAEKARRKAEKETANDLESNQKKISELEEKNKELQRQRDSALASYADNPESSRAKISAIDDKINDNEARVDEIESENRGLLKKNPELINDAALSMTENAVAEIDNRGKPDLDIFDGSFRRTLREVGSFPDPAPFPVVDGIPDDIGDHVLKEQEETLEALNDDNREDELEGEAEDSDEEPEAVPLFQGDKRHATQKAKTKKWFQDALNGRKGVLSEARDFFSGFSGSMAKKGGTFPVVKKEDLQWLRATPDDPFFGIIRPTASTSAEDLVIVKNFDVVADRVGQRVELSLFGGGNPIVNPDLWEPVLRARNRWKAAILANEKIPMQVRVFIANRYANRTSMYAPIFGWNEGAIQRRLERIYQRLFTRTTALFLAYSKSGQYSFSTCRMLANVADMMRAVQLDVAKLRLFMIVTQQSQDPQFAELLLEALKMYIAIHLFFNIRDSYMVVLSTQLTGEPWYDRQVSPGLDLLLGCRFPKDAPLNRLIADGRIGPQDLFVHAEPEDIVSSFFARGALEMASEQRTGANENDVTSSESSSTAFSEQDMRALSQITIYKAELETSGIRMPAHAGAGVIKSDTLISVINSLGISFARMALYHQHHPTIPLEDTPYAAFIRYVVPLRYWFLLSHSEGISDMHAKLVFLRLAGVTRSIVTKGKATLEKWKDLTALLGIRDDSIPTVAAAQISVAAFLSDPRCKTKPLFFLQFLKSATIPTNSLIFRTAVPIPGWKPPSLHLMEKGLYAVAIRLDELLLDADEDIESAASELLGMFVVLAQKSIRGRFDFDQLAQSFQRLTITWGESLVSWIFCLRRKKENSHAMLQKMLQHAADVGQWMKTAAGERAYELWTGYIQVFVSQAEKGNGASDYDDLRALGSILDDSRKTISFTVSKKQLAGAKKIQEMAAGFVLSASSYHVSDEVPYKLHDISTLALLQALLGTSFWSPKPSTPQQEALAWARLSRKMLIERQETQNDYSEMLEREIYRRVFSTIVSHLGPTRGANVARFFTQYEAQEMSWIYFFVWWIYHNVPCDTLMHIEETGNILSGSCFGITHACKAIYSVPTKQAKVLWDAVEKSIINAQQTYKSKTLPKPSITDTESFFKIHQHNIVNGYFALLLMPMYGCGFSKNAQQTDKFSLQALGGSSDPLEEARSIGSGILKSIETTLKGASEIYYSFAEQLLVARVCLARYLWAACDQQNKANLIKEFDKATTLLQKIINLVKAVDKPTARVLTCLYHACLVETNSENSFSLFKVAFTD